MPWRRAWQRVARPLRLLPYMGALPIMVPGGADSSGRYLLFPLIESAKCPISNTLIEIWTILGAAGVFGVIPVSNASRAHLRSTSTPPSACTFVVAPVDRGTKIGRASRIRTSQTFVATEPALKRVARNSGAL